MFFLSPNTKTEKLAIPAIRFRFVKLGSQPPCPAFCSGTSIYFRYHHLCEHCDGVDGDHDIPGEKVETHAHEVFHASHGIASGGIGKPGTERSDKARPTIRYLPIDRKIIYRR